MGHTLAEWQTAVQGLVRDAGAKDLQTADVDIGIRSALAQYGIDRPRLDVVEVAGAGSSYFALPSGWVDEWSHLEAVEYPARMTPPQILDDQAWIITRDPVDVTVKKILLLSAVPAAGQYVRFTITVPWPMPTGTASVDKVDAQAYEAVTALAAARCCVSLAGEASRSRAAALPTDFAGGENRAQRLTEAARTYQSIYDRFLGYATADQGGSSVGPASRRFDFDPAFGSVFHGGRR